jgi:hypothetical protein
VIFTVPQPIATIALQNKDVVYNILFRATSETLRTIAADPKHLGAQIGFFAVLHTCDPTAIDRSLVQLGRLNLQAGSQRSIAPDVSDRLAPARSAAEPAVRQHPRPDAKIVYGEVS